MADEGMNNVQRHTVRALAWIVGALREHDVSYQVVGGLAARAYGANRPLADIDLYVPFDLAAGPLGEIRPFVTWGPERYVDEAWDITFLKLDLYGQRIELGDSSTDPRFFSARMVVERGSTSTTPTPPAQGCSTSRSRLCRKTS